MKEKTAATTTSGKRRRYLSIKSFLIMSITLLIALSLTIITAGIMIFFGEKQTSDLLDETEIRAMRLANDLSLYNLDLKTEDTSLDTDIDESAYFSNGRIMVISRGYQIIKDTYVLKQMDYIVSQDVMTVMTGKEARIKRVRGSYAEIILPIERDGEIIGAIVSTASIAGIDARFNFLTKQTLIIMSIVFILDIIVIVLIARVAVKRLDAINRQIYHTSQGNLQDKILEKGFRETRYLARNYNAVLEKLATVDTARQEFVSNVSHELKTPITSMKVLAESLLQNENATVNDYHEFMVDIVDEVDRETQIINDLLTLVRTDKQSSAMNFEKTEINDLLDGIIKTVMPLARQRNIEITYESYRDVVAEVDAVKLSLAISNLIENAVKYNIDNGWIRVSLNADNKYFYVKVADSGVGIPDDAKDKVFERFYRVDKARSRDTGGTGLGLSITRNIINAHQGIVRLYSESGKGTTFSVRLPLVQGEALDYADIAADKEMEEETDNQKVQGIKKAVLYLAMGIGLTALSVTFTACGNIEEASTQDSITFAAGTVQLYHVENNSVVADSTRLQLKQPDSVADSLEETMAGMTFVDGFQFQSYTIDKDGNASLTMTSDGLNDETLLLSKAAIVKSISGLTDIADMTIIVNDTGGRMIEADTYRDNSFFYYDDAEDSAINRGEIVLYLPDEDGSGLKRVVAYVTISSDESAEDAVLSQLKAYNVFPAGTEIKDISVMNHSATLNLSSEFMNGNPSISDEDMIYSIVDSLTSLPNVRSVQFLVEGEKVESYNNEISLGGMVEFRDPDR